MRFERGCGWCDEETETFLAAVINDFHHSVSFAGREMRDFFICRFAFDPASLTFNVGLRDVINVTWQNRKKEQNSTSRTRVRS